MLSPHTGIVNSTVTVVVCQVLYMTVSARKACNTGLRYIPFVITFNTVYRTVMIVCNKFITSTNLIIQMYPRCDNRK